MAEYQKLTEITIAEQIACVTMEIRYHRQCKRHEAARRLEAVLATLRTHEAKGE